MKFLMLFESAIAEPRSGIAPQLLRSIVFRFLLTRLMLSSVRVVKPLTRLSLRQVSQIDIDEEGLVQIFSSDQDAIDRAKTIISDLVREAKVGRGLHRTSCAY